MTVAGMLLENKLTEVAHRTITLKKLSEASSDVGSSAVTLTTYVLGAIEKLVW